MSPSRCCVFFTVFFLFSGCVFLEQKKQEFTTLKFQATSNGEVPWNISSTYSAKAPLFRALFTQPVYKNEDLEIEKGIFKSWAWRSKTKSFKIDLDPRYKVRDGRSIEASDIEFAFLKFYISKERGEITPPHYLDQLKGIKKLKKGTPFKSGICECLKVISKFQLELYIEKNDEDYLESFADFYYPISKPDFFEEDYFTFKNIPRGSGPYYIEKMDLKNGHLTLRKREGYLNGEFSPSAPLAVEFYFSGEDWKNNVDVSSGRGSERLQKNSDFRIVNMPFAYAAFVISFNFENNLGRDVDFRKAISLAIDRRKLNPGQPGVVPHKHLYLNPKFGIKEDVLENQPALSRKIVQSKLSSKFDLNRPIKAIYFSSYKRSEDPDFIKKLEEQFAEVGLNINIEQNNFENIKKGNHSDIAFYVKGKGFPIDDMLFPLYFYLEDDDQSLTFDRSNEKIMKLYRKAKNEEKKSVKKNLAQRLTNYLNQNFINVTLDRRYKVYLVNKKVKALNINNPEGVIDFAHLEMR